jgi:predicted kinase
LGEGIYTAEWTERTYAECLARAERLLFEGNRVIVDASFGEEAQRRTFLEAATRLGVPAVMILCQAAPDVVRQRLHDRRGDASDADWSVYQAACARWEDIGPGTRELVRPVSTMGARDQALAQALEVLAEADVGAGRCPRR